MRQSKIHSCDAIGWVGVGGGLAPHEPQRRGVDVLRARHHAVAVVDHDHGRIAQTIDEDHALAEPEVVVALDATSLARGVAQQVERARPGELGVGADTVIAVAPAVPGGVVVAHPLVLIAGQDRLLRLRAVAVLAHVGA